MAGSIGNFDGLHSHSSVYRLEGFLFCVVKAVFCGDGREVYLLVKPW